MFKLILLNWWPSPHSPPNYPHQKYPGLPSLKLPASLPPENRRPRKGLSSKHPFSGAMFVSFREGIKGLLTIGFPWIRPAIKPLFLAGVSFDGVGGGPWSPTVKQLQLKPVYIYYAHVDTKKHLWPQLGSISTLWEVVFEQYSSWNFKHQDHWESNILLSENTQRNLWENYSKNSRQECMLISSKQ